MDELKKYIDKHKYLVINYDTVNIYTSLRKISNDIEIDYTTISKKLKTQNECICNSKKTKKFYYIKKL